MRYILPLLAAVVLISLPSPLTPAAPVEPLQADEPPPIVAALAEPVPEPPRYTPTPWERKLLAALAEQEDSSSPEAMQAVVEVVLNRIESQHPSFAELRRVEDALYQVTLCHGKPVAQYQGARRLAKAEPGDAAFEAVYRACKGERLVGDALFHAEASVPAWRIANGIALVGEYGLTKFYKLEG